MTERVDFYILPGTGAQACELFACRLIEKAYNQQLRIFVRARDAAQAKALDERLWTFRQGSFLPHGLLGGDDEPILIGDHLPQGAQADLLVNLAPELPDNWQRFARLAEVVDQDTLQPARERFRQYRSGGQEPHYHTFDKEPG